MKKTPRSLARPRLTTLALALGSIQPARVKALYTKIKPLLRGHLVQGLIQLGHACFSLMQ